MPTVYDFFTLSEHDKQRVVSLANHVALDWQIVSPASELPYKYHPDPDPHNWGVDVLAALHRLAKMTQAKLSDKEQAVQLVCDSIETRNRGITLRLLVVART